MKTFQKLYIKEVLGVKLSTISYPKPYVCGTSHLSLHKDKIPIIQILYRKFQKSVQIIEKNEIQEIPQNEAFPRLTEK